MITDEPVDVSNVETPEVSEILVKGEATLIFNDILGGYSKRQLNKLKKGWPTVSTVEPPPPPPHIPERDPDPDPVEPDPAEPGAEPETEPEPVKPDETPAEPEGAPAAASAAGG